MDCVKAGKQFFLRTLESPSFHDELSSKNKISLELDPNFQFSAMDTSGDEKSSTAKLSKTRKIL